MLGFNSMITKRSTAYISLYDYNSCFFPNYRAGEPFDYLGIDTQDELITIPLSLYIDLLLFLYAFGSTIYIPRDRKEE